MLLLAWEAGQFTVQCPPLFSNLKLPFPINRSLAFPPASSQCLYSIKFLGVSKRCLYVSHVHPGGVTCPGGQSHSHWTTAAPGSPVTSSTFLVSFSSLCLLIVIVCFCVTKFPQNLVAKQGLLFHRFFASGIRERLRCVFLAQGLSQS